MTLNWKQTDKEFGSTNVYVGKDGERKARITLAKGYPADLTIETLVHEFAHVLSWDYYGNDENSAWGIAYAEVYRWVWGDH